MLPRAKILFVDDCEVDYVIVEKLVRKLARRDYHIDWSPTYSDAMRVLQRDDHDICIVDYRLGRNTGLELISDARDQGCAVPMILMTGQGSDDLDLEALDSGAAGYLDKHRLDAIELDRAIRYALRGDRARRELASQKQELLSLHSITELLIQPVAGPDTYDVVAKLIANQTSFPIASLHVIDRSTGTLERAGGFGDDDCEDWRAPALSRLMQSRRPELRTAPSRESADRTSSAYACLPLLSGDTLVGALCVAHVAPRPVESAQISRTSAIASHLANLLLSTHPELTRGSAPQA